MRSDLVDTHVMDNSNYARGWNWYLKTGRVIFTKADQEVSPNDGMIGIPDMHGHLVDPSDDMSLSANMFRHGSLDACDACDNWANGIEWQSCHLCPWLTHGKIRFLSDGTTATDITSFGRCIGWRCARWDSGSGRCRGS